MKKRIAGILISILALSALSGCGKEKDISYVDEPATTSDAATASVLHRNYEVTDGLLTFTVDADVDTCLSAQSSPLVKVSRNDYTKEDMKRIADAIFDAVTVLCDFFLYIGARTFDFLVRAQDIGQE